MKAKPITLLFPLCIITCTQNLHNLNLECSSLLLFEKSVANRLKVQLSALVKRAKRYRLNIFGVALKDGTELRYNTIQYNRRPAAFQGNCAELTQPLTNLTHFMF